MALVIGNSQFKFMHYYIQDSCILTLSYSGFRLDQLGSKLEDIAITIIILSPGCQQPFLIKMASANRLSAAIFGPKWLVTTGCQQPLPKSYTMVCPSVREIIHSLKLVDHLLVQADKPYLTNTPINAQIAVNLTRIPALGHVRKQSLLSEGFLEEP